jgi:hypothetical protein
VLLAVLLAGCSLISANSDIRGILEDQGVEPEGVGIQTVNGLTTLTVGYRTAAPDVAGALVESRKVAEALWKRAPVGFDTLRMEPSGAGNLEHITLSKADLEDEFGPRPEGAGGLTGGLMRDLAVLAIGGLVVLIGLGVLVALLVRRSRRRGRQEQGWPGQPPGSWPPSSAPPPPPGRW